MERRGRLLHAGERHANRFAAGRSEREEIDLALRVTGQKDDRLLAHRDLVGQR
jgi:hypothetical protein